MALIQNANAGQLRSAADSHGVLHGPVHFLINVNGLELCSNRPVEYGAGLRPDQLFVDWQVLNTIEYLSLSKQELSASHPNVTWTPISLP